MIIYICIHYTEAERWMRPGFSHEHRIQADRSVSFWVPLEKIQYIIYNIIYLHSIYNYIYIWTYMDVACLTVLGCNLWICSTHPGARCQQSLMLKSHRPWGQISISTSCLHILFTSAYIVYHIYIYIMCIYGTGPHIWHILFTSAYIVYHISYKYIYIV